mgnify:CR=1 FL=1|tara:strand:- start:3220 stop:3447 length:228 start_codon:yes stop_codon:yes gene_type:complete
MPLYRTFEGCQLDYDDELELRARKLHEAEKDRDAIERVRLNSYLSPNYYPKDRARPVKEHQRRMDLHAKKKMGFE